VLFDFDGTVVDTVELIRESHRHATRQVLGVELDDAKLVANVGIPLMDQMVAFSEQHAEELLRVYRQWNHRHTEELIKEYPGVGELLGALRAAGRPLGIVTSKARPVADLAFDVLPLRDYFDVIVTTEDTDRHKPAPDPVLHALSSLDARAEHAVMVGDAPFDLQAGAAAGCSTIAVTWGFFDRETLSVLGPDAVVDDVSELADLLLTP
jgi:pyrophosphatase PpaX